MNLSLAVIELVVADMAATLAFYRRLGLDVPDDADDAPHVEVGLPGGLRLALDTEDTIRSAPETLERLFKSAIDHGARRLILCDTSDTPLPMESRRSSNGLVSWFRAPESTSGSTGTDTMTEAWRS